MRRVILESPYAGDVTRNVAYARRALRDSLARGEAPIASHLLYPQVLDDAIPAEREQGIAAGLAWRKCAEFAVFYIDHDWSPGMVAARDLYDRFGIVYHVRAIGEETAGADLDPWASTVAEFGKLAAADLYHSIRKLRATNDPIAPALTNLYARLRRRP